MVAQQQFPPVTYLLPHRGNMQLIDEILTFSEEAITAQTYVKEDSPFLDGHFPNYPILPGVILVEIMYQACGLHGGLCGLKAAGVLDTWDQQDASAYEEMTTNMKSRAIGADKLVFKRPVFPGDTLLIAAKPVKSFFQFTTYEASIKNALTGDVITKSFLTVYSGKNN